MFRLSAILSATLFARLAVAQESGWQPGQVNATMCQWQNPRAAVVRDTVYIDGGDLWWVPGMNDNTYQLPTQDGNPLGLVYLLNFSTPFKTSDNISTVFTTISKAPNGGFANNLAPQYIDGAMFANDYEWFIYGGLFQLTDAYDAPDADDVASYQVFPSGPDKQFNQGYVNGKLPTGITRYLTYGAAVSVPSENLGFYFGGLRAADHGPIYYLPANESVTADTESTTLIQLNMTVQQVEEWTNDSLPSTVPGRANAELVWVPVSEQGILIAIGGVINPAYANINQTDNATDAAQSKRISPTFMSTVSVYDIASKTWYEQETDGGPGALAQGCTVMASAQDGSSHNIYWYGGYDGLDITGDFSDDVWILSVPSFMWMKVNSGTKKHARAGHKCARPYPDTMVVIGGYPSLAGINPSCLDGFIQVFNLSTATWIDAYDPEVWSNYTIPSMIYAMIGGSGTGSATQTAPSPTGFSNDGLGSVFSVAYPTSKITTYYPYHTAETSSKPIATPISHSSGTPKYLAPLLGVVLGLFFVTIVVLGILLWRRRRYLRSRAGTSDGGTMDNQNRILNWVWGTPAEKAPPTVTSTDETPSSPYSQDELPELQEVGGEQVHEMMDTSKPVEMDTNPIGFVHVPLTGTARDRDRPGLASSPSSASQTSRASTISRVSRASGPRPNISPIHSPIPRADSPPLGHSSPSPQPQSRVTSDVSGISERDQGHLRGISETSVSTVGDGDYSTPLESGGQRVGVSANVGPRPAPAPYRSGIEDGSTGRREGAVSPMTPPEGQDEQSGDYVGRARGSATRSESARRSQFEEGL